MSKALGNPSLYERLGGALAVEAAVDEFYVRVLADPQLKGFFSGVSMPRLKSHQFAFLSQALGGPREYGGADMQQARRRLAIEQRDFDGAATHLVETLGSLAVPEDIIDEIVSAIGPLSAQVVNTPSPAPAE